MEVEGRTCLGREILRVVGTQLEETLWAGRAVLRTHSWNYPSLIFWHFYKYLGTVVVMFINLLTYEYLSFLIEP